MSYSVRGGELAEALRVRALPEVHKMWELGVALNAPKPDENPSGMRGKEMRR
ncbi:MAG: hypothetical protein QW543_02015 [Sulfolobales archaeon]